MRISDWSSDVCSSDLDCTPVLFADTAAGVIGACHAGLRGALAGITDATIEAMEKLGARRDRIRAAVGPTIHQKSYEISAPFRATRSEEHTSELQSLMRISYAVFCLKKKKLTQLTNTRQLINEINHK